MTTAQPQPDGNLPAARTRLHDAISDLIDPRTELAGQPDCPDCHNQQCEPNCEAHTCPGHTTFNDPLYIQLYNAIPGAQGTGHSAARSLPPLWIDAARLVAFIDTAVRRWQPDYPHCTHCTHCRDTLPAVQRLQAIRAKRWRPQDCATINDYAAQIEAWVTDIDVLLTPQPIRALWAAEGGGFAACPACNATMAKKQDNAGETVGTPALQLATDGSTHCLACHTTWGCEHATWVCRMLGYPLPAGVLE